MKLFFYILYNTKGCSFSLLFSLPSSIATSYNFQLDSLRVGRTLHKFSHGFMVHSSVADPSGHSRGIGLRGFPNFCILLQTSQWTHGLWLLWVFIDVPINFKSDQTEGFTIYAVKYDLLSNENKSVWNSVLFFVSWISIGLYLF